ncbi:MAG: DNA polymerase III subunit alpha, partial [Dehalococcoidia bacterium]|nr:DNA polymerase III subunit alpha [Dehalococcoidia bacterium]
AKDKTGYQNLMQIVTKAHLEGFYYKPRCDKNLLAKHGQGLVALSACTGGEVARLILQGRPDEARKAALWYKDVFGDFYLELQDHGIPEQQQVNREMLAMSSELGLPLVATNDLHYVNKADAYAHDILLCVGTNTTVNDEKRMKMPGDFFYLKSPQEMSDLFSQAPQAISNTLDIADKCNLQLEFGRLHLPEIELPPGKTPDEYLTDLCREGLKQRYPVVTEEIEHRLAYELDVIRQTQFANYFLVVWDMVLFVRKSGILFGVRGSAAASLVLYCLKITSIDPLATKLVFERFLNVERKEMPDIDLDFQDDRRAEVISYVSKKYGSDRVAQIITFGTLGAKAAIRDVGRALGMTYSDADRVARLVPAALNMTLKKAMEETSELRDLCNQDEAVKKLIDTAMKVEGITRHASTHAAGVVISKDPLTQHIPLQRASKDEQQGATMTQLHMDNIAKVGLLKMDFLGLANLTILQRVREMVARTRGVEIDLQNMPLDNKKAFDLLSSGDTVGVFQFEGAGMRRYLKDLKPSTFSDIAAMVALYRPGPLQHIPTFIKAKHGEQEIKYPHPALADILAETYGVIVYQDQVLRIVQVFAGYTLGHADIVRKAMGKKIPEVMKKERQTFIEGAIEKGFSREVAENVFALIEPFAGYAFNKAHSVSYAMLAYQTAYFKANFPAEFMCVLLTNDMGQAEKVKTAIGECATMGIPVLPPDINQSEENFSIEPRDGKTAIRFGMAGIKNVGVAALQPLLAARKEGGAFKSVEDFCRRTDLRGVNKRTLESLIKAGAFDCFGKRGALLQNLDRIMSASQREQQRKDSHQSTMFDMFGQDVPVPMMDLGITGEDVTANEKLEWEKELMGVNFSDDPFISTARELKPHVDTFCGQITAEMAGKSVTIGGRVTLTRLLMTKDGRSFVAAKLEDMDGSIEVTAWPEIYQRTSDLWTEGNILLVQGKVKNRKDEIQVSCDRVKLYTPEMPDEGDWIGNERANNGFETRTPARREPPPPKHRLFIKLAETGNHAADVTRLQGVFSALMRYQGQDKVHLTIPNSHDSVKLEFPDIATGYCPDLHQRLIELVGEAGLGVERDDSGAPNGQPH